MPFCPGACCRPPDHSSNAPSTHSRSRALRSAVGLEHRPVDDQVGVGVGPEEEDLGAEAGDLGVGERDGVAGIGSSPDGQSGSSRSFATSE